jgi:hypothetical protein
VNLLTQLPESDKTKERLSEILEERDLTFLYPLLRIQAELAQTAEHRSESTVVLQVDQGESGPGEFHRSRLHKTPS